MDSEFVNAYIERVTNEVAELTKTRLLLETQLQMVQKVNTELQKKIEKLEKPTKKKVDDFNSD